MSESERGGLELVFAGRPGWGGSAFWMAVLGPLVMLFFLFRITGIPPTERRAIARRGDAYREYQRTTSVFVPLPPKG